VLELSPEEARVVGALTEKQLTTPQYYPLTLNALVNACNQTSNRHPVVSYDEATVEDALRTSREKGVTRIVHQPGGRAPKYRQVLDEVLGLTPEERAVLCELMLRGPQTAGELRSRCQRLAGDRDDFGDVQAGLDRLSTREEPLVVRLERQPGQKEARWAHLLSGDIDTESLPSAPSPPRSGSRSSGESPEDLVPERLGELEVRRLRREVDELKAALGLSAGDAG
jgi:uncharacterized protein